jgi:hypothetical protein
VEHFNKVPDTPGRSWRNEKMASESNNKPPRMFKDKLLSLFGIGKPQKDEKGLPPKAHFSIWYFVLAMIFFFLPAATILFCKGGDNSIQQIQTIP